MRETRRILLSLVHLFFRSFEFSLANVHPGHQSYPIRTLLPTWHCPSTPPLGRPNPVPACSPLTNPTFDHNHGPRGPPSPRSRRRFLARCASCRDPRPRGTWGMGVLSDRIAGTANATGSTLTNWCGSTIRRIFRRSVHGEIRLRGLLLCGTDKHVMCGNAELVVIRVSVSGEEGARIRQRVGWDGNDVWASRPGIGH